MNVGIIGPGHAGCGLALALLDAGQAVRLHGRRPKDVPGRLRDVYTVGDPTPWLGSVDVVLLAVQDRAVGGAARELAESRAVQARHVVLHLSGIMDETPLGPLGGTGAALGTMHPLQSIAAPETAAARLKGALAAITGEPRAAACARDIARDVGMVPVVLDASTKAKYHAAAVMASNYLVVLAAVAEQLMLECGLDVSAAHRGVTALMRGTLENVTLEGAAQALTGPIARGDAETIRLNLAALDEKVGGLYRALGRAAADRLGGASDEVRSLL